MDPRGLMWTCLLVVSIGVCVVKGSPIATTTINCAEGGSYNLGSVDEGFSGDVELLTGIKAGTNVKLVSHINPSHLDFLELIFIVGATTATVRTKKPLDADVLSANDPTLHYSIMCDDLGKANNTRTLTVNDINDNGPVFEQKSYSTNVPETQAVESEVLRVTAVDTDVTAENNKLTYSVEPASDDFIVTDIGAFILKRQLNYNLVHEYNFIVTAKDSGGLKDTASVQINVVDVDNLNPVFNHNLYQAVIPENQVGPFHTIQPEAIKAQDGDKGINITLTYSISAVTPDVYLRNFNIDPSSGVVSVVTAFNREEMNSSMISINIKAAQTDDNLKTADAVVSVTVEDVNDEAPEFDQSEYNITLMENSPNDAVVFKVIITDQDQGGFVGTLRIVPESVPFSIGPDGTVTVKNSTALDREATESITFQIEARETSPPNTVVTAPVTVTLQDENDNSPVFVSDNITKSVPEDAEVGTNVTDVPATDKDSGLNKEIRYSLRGGEGRFALDPVTGMVSVAGALDRETKAEYNLLVVAEDQGHPARSSTATLLVRVSDVNDNIPEFSQAQYQVEVSETEDVGTSLLTVSAVDPDEGPNGRVSYSISQQNPSSDPAVFELDSTSGALRLVQPLDYSKVKEYQLKVQASDGGTPPLVGNSTVVVTVKDENNNPPEFSSSSYVSSILLKDAEEGKLLLTLSATDKDAGDNARITYSFSEGASPYLALNSETGAVTLTSNLSHVTEDTTLKLTAMATDHGRPPLNATVPVVVNFTVGSFEGVVFLSPTYNFSLPENEAAGASVGRVQASAGSDIYNVAYAVRTHSDLFSVDANGDIVTKAELDKEKQEWYILDVEAVDTRTPPTSATAVVRVQVEDVNEPPQFESELYKAAVFSIAPYNTSVTRVQATDPDVGEDGRLSYSLSAPSSHFDVDPSSGLVYVLSVESLSGQTVLEVKATDGAGLQAATRVEVDVQGSASNEDVVTISLNRPVNVVEENVPELEKSLGSVLGWTVKILQVNSPGRGSTSKSRSSRSGVRTMVSFISTDGDKVVSSEEVTKELDSQSAAVTNELVNLFGEGVDFIVEVKPPGPDSNQAGVIAGSVVGVLALIALIGGVLFALERRGSLRLPPLFRRGSLRLPPLFRRGSSESRSSRGSNGLNMNKIKEPETS